MTLKIHYKKKSHGVTWKCGHMYNFKYSNYESDPSPTYLHLYSFSGYHPNTGREWRFHQGINLAYLPRKIRKKFIKDWKKEFGKGQNFKITWKNLVKKYPYLKEFTRRYFTSPAYMIRQAKFIPPEKGEEQIIKSWAKDFSKTIRRKVGAKIKQFFAGKRKK